MELVGFDGFVDVMMIDSDDVLYIVFGEGNVVCYVFDGSFDW